ncbi:MAG: type III pantothenate kinase [Proteobacteria bacterium]|nr:type III pantothenate kinase [Pseudomonadota bacterium]
MNRHSDPARVWLFDLGNSRLKWRRAEAMSTRGAQALAHDGTLDEATLATVCAEVDAGDCAWLASVASPAVTEALLAALARRGAIARRATTRAELTGVRIAYAQPQRLGVDRFLALLAAHARAPQPWLVIGVGTALTIDLLAADGHHLGGLIAPSPTLMRQALTQRAAHLPSGGGRIVDFASDTDDALASGTLLAARALIERSRHAARKRLGVAPPLLIAGGGGDALLAGWRVQATRAPDLVLEGLARYAAALAPDAP